MVGCLSLLDCLYMLPKVCGTYFRKRVSVRASVYFYLTGEIRSVEVETPILDLDATDDLGLFVFSQTDPMRIGVTPIGGGVTPIRLPISRFVAVRETLKPKRGVPRGHLFHAISSQIHSRPRNLDLEPKWLRKYKNKHVFKNNITYNV